MSEWCLETFPVLDHGFVRVVDFMGDDSAIVQAARVSYGDGTRSVREDRGLIRYLMAHDHTSPFEMCEIKLHVKMPIFVARQWVRHRTAAMNEISGRYSQISDQFYLPELEDVSFQATNNKQGRGEGIDRAEAFLFTEKTAGVNKFAYRTYEHALDRGIARELARINLPLSTYTEFYWKQNLHNLLHFLRLRCDPHAQLEIRRYADTILHKIVQPWVPHTYQAFLDYRMNSVRLSAQQVELVRYLISIANRNEAINPKAFGLSDRELSEVMEKLA